jgi:ribosomal protein S18 acetylase RimI-like enzyme
MRPGRDRIGCVSAEPDARPLDNPVRSSLLGPHARFAQRHGGVLRYLPSVSPFAALMDQPGNRDWADAAALAGPGGLVPLAGVTMPPPAGWKPVLNIPCVQMIDAGIAAAPDDEAVRLGAPDVPQMLDLVARTEPGPFLPGTIEMGIYLGIRRGGALVAMAGERLHPPGWTEISAVCTDGAYRDRGLGTRLVLAVAAGIRARGETPFLHAAASNVNAIRLYESLGFRFRRDVLFSAARAPLTGAAR